MIVNRQISLLGRIDSLAVSPDGNHAVAALDGERLLVLDLAGEVPVPWNTFALPAYPGEGVSIRETRVAYLDDRTIVVARTVERRSPGLSMPLEERHRTSLLAVDAETGDVRGGYETPGLGMLGVDPVPVPPNHVLLSVAQKTLACVDVDSWREVHRLRELDQEYDPVGSDADYPEEMIATNGVAYVPDCGLLFVLWGYAYASVLQSYRFDPGGSGFESVLRSRIENLEPLGLCVRPDGAAVAAFFDDLRSGHVPALPAQARLGVLGHFFGGEERRLDVQSEAPRDFDCAANKTIDSEGREVVTGYSVAINTVSADGYEPRMFYLDDGRILLTSPSGLLLGIDPKNGRTEVLHDCGSRVEGIAFHRGSRMLLIGGADRTLTLLTT